MTNAQSQTENITGLNADNTSDTIGYELQVRDEIEAWKNPDKTILSKTLSTFTLPIEKAGAALMAAPEWGEALKQATEKTLTTLSDAANWTLDEQAVLATYQKSADSVPSASAVPLEKLADIQSLPLAVVDQQVNLFKSKYVALTSAQGIATGVIGWAGIPADIVALLTANLRAVGEYATYFGFDITKKGEQLFAMSLLAIATSAPADERKAALNDTLNLIREPEVLAFNKVNEEVMSRVLRQTATKVATNLVKTKAAQLIPAVGAVVAGGVNASYTASVCEAAHQCYRERFLNHQHRA